MNAKQERDRQRPSLYEYVSNRGGGNLEGSRSGFSWLRSNEMMVVLGEGYDERVIFRLGRFKTKGENTGIRPDLRVSAGALASKSL